MYQPYSGIFQLIVKSTNSYQKTGYYLKNENAVVKLVFTVLLLSCVNIYVQAQYLPGIRSSNFNGVLGTYSNPSNALGQYNWDVHLVGVDVLTANKNGKISLSDIGEDNYLRTRLIGDEGFNDGMLRLDVPAIGFMAGIGKRAALAFTTRARVFLNASNIDAKFVNALADDGSGTSGYPYVFPPATPTIVNANALADYALTWAHELVGIGPHYLKAGATVKYVSGVGNIGYRTQLSGKIDEDVDGSFISPANGTVSIRNGGSAFVDDFSAGKLFEFNGGGVGFDLGMTYEYRPMEWKKDISKKGRRAHGFAAYLFKFSASVVDIGKVKFDAVQENSKSYNVHIPANSKFYFSEFDDVEYDNATQVLDAYPQYFTNTSQTTGSYKISLPTTVQLTFDYNIGKGFFVNVDAQIGLNSADDPDKIKTFNYYSFTPRYDGRMLGCFLPITYHQLSGLSVGAAFHLGPLYIGSGSIISLIAGGSKQADAFFGFRFGGLKNRK